MRKFWKLAVATSVVAVSGLVAGAIPAGATPPAGYGFDGSPHAVVGGGSDTTYKAQLGLTELYMSTSISGCEKITTVGPTLGKCNPVATPELNTNLGNYQGDTIGQANPTGSGSGIGSLNGQGGSSTTYAGTANPVDYTCAGGGAHITTTGPNVDFARSSRPPKATSGNTPCGGSELDNDTFWGFAQDGIEVAAFTAARGANLQALGGTALTPNQLFNIWNCSGGTGAGGRMRWQDVLPSLAGQPRGLALIEPWGMNSSAGTFATFQTFIQQNASGVPVGWSPNGQACDRKLQSGLFPLENDIKNEVNDPVTLSTDPASADNPDNWIHWGSFGVFSAFPFTSNFTRQAHSYQLVPAPINGITPSSSGIIANTYPIGRTLFHVTLKQDADCVKTAGACDFAGHPGPAIAAGGTDLNVTGGASGQSGAIREYTRFLCRGTATQHGKNPYTGNNNFTEITAKINGAGFTVVPSSLRTPGSRCAVSS